jgi:site-specific DNA-methyltransferase (adenine-specific)
MGMDQETTVLRADKPNSADLHPTVKPQALLSRLILNSTKRGWPVLDLFGGSGSTLIACQQLGRQCYMMELDPHYTDVIISRWEAFTGKVAVKMT